MNKTAEQENIPMEWFHIGSLIHRIFANSYQGETPINELPIIDPCSLTLQRHCDTFVEWIVRVSLLFLFSLCFRMGSLKCTVKMKIIDLAASKSPLAAHTQVEGIWIQYFVQSASHIVSMKSIFVFASALILYFYTAFNLLFPTKGPWLLLFYYLLQCCLWARIKISVDHLISSLSNFSSSLNTVLQTY